MIRLIPILLITLLSLSCVGARSIVRGVDTQETKIIDNMSTKDEADDRILTVLSKRDGKVKYIKTAEGYTIDINNEGAKSFTRAVAEKIVEKTDIVLTSAESVGDRGD